MKKILLTLGAVLAVTAGVVGMSAFEAHVINVTAHIENAMRVNTDPISFGTVFPQEYLTKPLDISLSESFVGQDQNGKDEVDYKIQQKPKPLLDIKGATVQTTLTAPAGSGTAVLTVASVANFAVGDDVAIGYLMPDMERGVISAIGASTITLSANLANNHATGEVVIRVYKDLCRFLSKTSTDPNTVSVPSYFIPAGPGAAASCATPVPDIATGLFDVSDNPTHLVDHWTIDLKVPPVLGNVGQDWPSSCASYVVPTDGADYGCDLWVEVTNIAGEPIVTPTPTPTPTPI